MPTENNVKAAPASARRSRPACAVPVGDTVAMDVTSDDSVAAAVAEVLASTGRIDAIVNNAGISKFGAVEETTTSEALSGFQTNFFGVGLRPTLRADRRTKMYSHSSRLVQRKKIQVKGPRFRRLDGADASTQAASDLVDCDAQAASGKSAC